MGRTPVEDVQKSFSGQVDAHRYEEGSDKQAENQTEFPEETNLLLLVVLCLNHTQCDKTTICAAKFIEELLNLSLRIIASRESAIVFAFKERGGITGARFKEGEENRFEQVGLQVGPALAAAVGVIPI